MTLFHMQGLDVEKCPPRILAHLGDAVYELWLRQLMMDQVASGSLSKVEAIHKWTTQRANAAFQVGLLQLCMQYLSDSEQQLIKRARNSPVSVGRRSNQALHRQATAFEALLGYWYCHDQNRLETILLSLEEMVIAGKIIGPEFPKAELEE